MIKVILVGVLSLMWSQVFGAANIKKLNEHAFTQRTTYYTALFTNYSPGELFNRLSPEEVKKRGSTDDAFDFIAWEGWAYQFIELYTKKPKLHKKLSSTTQASLFKGFVAGGFRADHMMHYLNSYIAKNYKLLLEQIQKTNNESDNRLKLQPGTTPIDQRRLQTLLKNDSDLSFLCGFLAMFLQSAVSDNYLTIKKDKLKIIINSLKSCIGDAKRRMKLYVFLYIQRDKKNYRNVLRKWIKNEFFPGGGRYDSAGQAIQEALKAMNAD